MMAKPLNPPAAAPTNTAARIAPHVVNSKRQPNDSSPTPFFSSAEARAYAEYLLTLPVRADGKSAGFNAEPEVKPRRTGGGATATSAKPANPADLISATDRQLAALVNMGSKKLIGDAIIRHLAADIRIQDIVDRAHRLEQLRPIDVGY